MKHFFISLLFLFTFFTSQAQDETLKVLSYNLLNYPSSAAPNDFRADTLKKIIDYYTPDLFLMQELKSSSGLSTILNSVFNTDGIDYYASGTWEPQHSNPGSIFKLQQNLIYNTQKLTIEYQTFLFTVRRDINIFKFYFNDPNLPLNQTKTFLYVAVWHLKSSQDTVNENQRLQMTEILENFLDTIPENSSVIVGGDYNLYTSSEPAYQNLLNPANIVTLADPINTPGNWHNNFNFRFVHSQSTRTAPINGDGAGGGIDDRFDFILVSENIMDPSNPITFTTGTYHPLGNNGNCFNQRIIDCENNTVPDNILNALYQMSDHVPIQMELDIEYPLVSSVANQQLEISAYTIRNEELILSAPSYQKPIGFTLYSLSGKILLSGDLPNLNQSSISLNGLSIGTYILRFNDASIKPLKFFKAE